MRIIPTVPGEYRASTRFCILGENSGEFTAAQCYPQQNAGGNSRGFTNCLSQCGGYRKEGWRGCAWLQMTDACCGITVDHRIIFQIGSCCHQLAVLTGYQARSTKFITSQVRAGMSWWQATITFIYFFSCCGISFYLFRHFKDYDFRSFV